MQFKLTVRLLVFLCCFYLIEAQSDPNLLESINSLKKQLVKTSNLAVDYEAVSQSTTSFDRVADRAVDGNKSSDFNFNRCTHTANSDADPWWEVKLNQVYAIGRVEITNRKDQFANRLRNLKIEVGVGSANKECGTFDGPADDSRALFIIVCDKIIDGDIIRITKTGSILTLCEVEIYSFQYPVQCLKTSNLANDHKAVSQSTTKLERSADRAVDGNTSPVFSSDSCTHTNDDDENPWWQVTLDKVYPIGRIEIINRQDQFANRLRNLKIEAGNGSANTLCDTFYGPADDSRALITIMCKNVIHGDIVRITKTEPGILTLCEVQVYTF